MTATMEMGLTDTGFEGTGASNEMERYVSNREVHNIRSSVTVMEIVPLLPIYGWRIEKTSKPKQYSEILMFTPRKFVQER